MSEKETCPFCSREFVDLESHLKNNSRCNTQYIGSLEEGITEANEQEGETEAERETRTIKYVDDLNFEEINMINKEGAEKLKKWLKDHDFATVQQLANAKVDEITMRGIGDSKGQAIIDLAREALGVYFMVRVSDIPTDYSSLKFGVPGLDRITGGGFRTGESYEFYGPFKTGKTQIALHQTIRLQFPIEKGGFYDPDDPYGRPQCLWVDSEQTIKGIIEKNEETTGMSRLEEVTRWQYMKEYPHPLQEDDENDEEFEERCQRYEEDIDAFCKHVEDNLIMCFVVSSEHQINTVKKVMKRMAEFNFKLIVVDSLITHFRAEYVGRANLAERQQLLNNHIHDLQILKGKDAILVITNQVHARPDGFHRGGADFNFDATGGHIVQHNINNRYKCRKGKGESVHIELADSSYLKPDETSFLITEKGIESFED